MANDVTKNITQQDDDIYKYVLSDDIYDEPSNILNYYYGKVVIKGLDKTYKFKGDIFNILALFLSNKDNNHFKKEISRQMAIALADYINSPDTIINNIFIYELRQILQEKQSSRKPRTKKRDKYNLSHITSSMYFEAEANPKRKQTGVVVGDVFYALKYIKGSKGSLFHLYDQGWTPKPGRERKLGPRDNKPIEAFAFFLGNDRLLDKFNTLFDNIISEHPEIFKNVLSSIDINAVVTSMANDEELLRNIEIYGDMISQTKDIKKIMKRYLIKNFINMQTALSLSEIKSDISTETIASILADSYGEIQANAIVNSMFSDNINIKKQTPNSEGKFITKEFNISGVSSAKHIMDRIFMSLSASETKRISQDYNMYMSMTMKNMKNLFMSGQDVNEAYSYLYKLNKNLNFLVGEQQNNESVLMEHAASTFMLNTKLKSTNASGYISYPEVVERYLKKLYLVDKEVGLIDYIKSYNNHTDINKDMIANSEVKNIKEILELNKDQVSRVIEKDKEVVKEINDFTDVKINSLVNIIDATIVRKKEEKRIEAEKKRIEEELLKREAMVKKYGEDFDKLEEITNEEPVETVEIDINEKFSDEDLEFLSSLQDGNDENSIGGDFNFDRPI